MTKILGSPARYIQGRKVLQNIGEHVEKLGKNALVLISEGGYKRVGNDVEKALEDAGVQFHFEYHQGETSKKEIERLCEIVKDKEADLVIGIGGGKILDTAKAVAYYEDVPVVISPTAASTDAPTSALSVIYTDDGAFEEYLFLPKNPDMVLMDTEVISKAPIRLFVAGMGDALATYFEGRMAVQARAENMVGGQPTRAAVALTELCYDILMEEGRKAKLALEAGALTEAVEQVVEANTLLSGIGFESAGLSAAHAVHNAMSAVETDDVLHGEIVSFGVITQLMLENAPEEELEEVLDFCLDVGLPVCLEDLGVTDPSEEELRKVAEAAADPEETAQNMPVTVNTDTMYAALLAADALGRRAKENRNEA